MQGKSIHPVGVYPEVSTLTGIIKGKCPHCRHGKMFAFPFWNLLRFARQNHNCNTCGQDFLIEPGFYYGAMYFTYMVNVITIILGLCVSYFGFGIEDPLLISIPPMLIIVALTPLNFRLSRILWLYFFGDIKYQPDQNNEGSKVS